MNYRKTIRQWLLGTSLPQEFLCVEEGLEYPLSIFASGVHGAFFTEVSQNHLFLGYRPLIMAVTYHQSSKASAWMKEQDRVCFSFVPFGFAANDRWHGFTTDHRSIARLMLKKIRTVDLGDEKVYLFQGEAGEHVFLSDFHQGTNRVREALKRRQPGNVSLPGNLYDQVITAYSIPRHISLISTWNGDSMNIFPTDLHGQAGNYYLGSLRVGGNANAQVEETGVIAVSRVATDACRQAYAAGKNHMAAWRSPVSFELSGVRSASGIPLPAGALSYKELRRTGSIDAGIHRVHFYEIIEEKELAGGTGLAHIHRYYGQWRLDHQLPTKMFFR